MGIEQLFNIARDIYFYRCYYLKSNTIRVLIIIIYIDQYFLYEELYIIKASNSIKEEILLKNINNNKLRDFKIKKLINNNKEDSDLNKNINNN